MPAHWLVAAVFYGRHETDQQCGHRAMLRSASPMGSALNTSSAAAAIHHHTRNVEQPL